jgi:hypothetical protein
MKRKVFLVLVLIVSLVLIAGLVSAGCKSKSPAAEAAKELAAKEADADGDWISDRLEVQVYGTDPHKMDTDGDGIDDFNEIFTYPHLLNPLNPADAKEFLAAIPNVKAKMWKWYEAGDTGSKAPFTKIISVAKRDPLVQWYARHTYISWADESHTYGGLVFDGEPFSQPYIRGIDEEVDRLDHIAHPAFYLTHGRTGPGGCGEVATAQYAVLESKGYDCVMVTQKIILVSGEESLHGALEVNIEGRVYVISGVMVKEAESYYRNNPNITVLSREDL